MAEPASTVLPLLPGPLLLSAGRLLIPRTAGWAGVGHGRFGLAHTPSAAARAASLTGIGYAASAAARDRVGAGLAVAPAVLALGVGVRVYR